MNDLGKRFVLRGAEGLRHSGKGTLSRGTRSLGSTCMAVCIGLRAGTQKTLFDSSSSVLLNFLDLRLLICKMEIKSYKIGLRINSIDLELPEVITVSEYMRLKR